MKYVTAENIKEKLCSLSNMEKRADNFLVTYYNLPENVANLLTRQTKDITRPDIIFEFSETNHRRNVYKNQAFLRFDPINISLADDDDSITSMIINAQMFRQLNKHKDVFSVLDPTFRRNYKFDIKLELINSKEEVTEGYIFKNCFISSFSYTQPAVASEEKSEIMLIVQYDNIDVLLFDEYVTAL